MGLLPRESYVKIISYMNDLLSNNINGLRKLHDSQYCLIKMLDNRKNGSTKGDSVCPLFMDLSNAFDTINNDLLLAKLKVYVFSKDALTVMCSSLKNRKQRVATAQAKQIQLLPEFHKDLLMTLYYSILLQTI